MARTILKLSTIFILLLPAILGGCIGGTSQYSVYYVFSTSQDISTAPSPLKDHALGVGPVKLPGFLKRPHIVTRQEQNLLTINEFHRWGDSLEEQITGVLVENLSAQLNTPNVSAYPWERPFAPSYQLFVDFRRFDGRMSDSVKLETIWWVVDTKQHKRLITRRFSLKIPTNGDGYKSYVIALNTALETLCRKMAEGVIEVLH